MRVNATLSAAVWSITCEQSALGTAISVPLWSVTLLMAIGLQ